MDFGLIPRGSAKVSRGFLIGYPVLPRGGPRDVGELGLALRDELARDWDFDQVENWRTNKANARWRGHSPAVLTVDRSMPGLLAAVFLPGYRGTRWMRRAVGVFARKFAGCGELTCPKHRSARRGCQRSVRCS